MGKSNEGKSFGVYYVAKATLPYLKQNKEGDIVNVCQLLVLKVVRICRRIVLLKQTVISLQSLMAELRKFNIRVITLTPSTIATDMSIEGKLTDGNPEKCLQPEDFAEWVRDILKMNRRAMITSASIFYQSLTSIYQSIFENHLSEVVLYGNN